jgi:hypothetical protein
MQYAGKGEKCNFCVKFIFNKKKRKSLFTLIFGLFYNNLNCAQKIVKYICWDMREKE